jgi:hypothetical protein
MMLNYENIQKIEGSVEHLIKRIQKAYLDVEPKADVTKMLVESKDLGNGTSSLLQLIPRSSF